MFLGARPNKATKPSKAPKTSHEKLSPEALLLFWDFIWSNGSLGDGTDTQGKCASYLKTAVSV